MPPLNTLPATFKFPDATPSPAADVVVPMPVVPLASWVMTESTTLNDGSNCVICRGVWVCADPEPTARTRLMDVTTDLMPSTEGFIHPPHEIMRAGYPVDAGNPYM